MLILIAIHKDKWESSGVSGFRILDTDTMKYMDATVDSVCNAVTDGKVTVENLDENDVRAVLRNYNSDILDYPEIVKNRPYPRKSMVCIGAESSEDRIVVDAFGSVHQMSVSDIREFKIRLFEEQKLYGRDMKRHIIPINSMMKYREIEALLENKVRKYMSKRSLLGCSNIMIKPIGGNITLISAGYVEGTFSIPSLVTHIGDKAFERCDNLRDVKLHDNVQSIGCEAFYECESLEQMTIPESVEFIGPGAFAYSGLETMTIPESIKFIGPGAFEGSDLKTIDVKASISVIPDYVFAFCDYLEYVRLPSTVECIDEFAFSDSGLKEIKIPDTVEVIGKGAFKGCGILEHVELSNNLREIHESAFSLCSSLKEIIIPRNLKLIKEGAFYGCESLEDVVIDDKSNVEIKDIQTLRVLDGRG